MHRASSCQPGLMGSSHLPMGSETALAVTAPEDAAAAWYADTQDGTRQTDAHTRDAMSDVQRLAVAVLGFLNEQLRAGTLSEDATESLEVATQCLETAFGVTAADSHLAVSRPLLDIFVEATQDEPVSPPQPPREPSCAVSSETTTHPPAEQTSGAQRGGTERNQYMREERYSEAVECYTHAIELHQQNAVYFCNRAAAYSKLSNYVGAVQDCERAIVIDPNYSKAYGRMGLALTSLGKHEEAVEFYRRAVELDPDNEGYRGNLELAESRGREATSPNATPPGGFDLAGILNNPGFMAMAANMMQNPQLQQMMSGMMSGGFSGGVPGVGTGGINDMAGLIQAGQQFAQTMQQENPELIEQLRSQIRSRPASASHDDLPPPYQPPPPPPPQPPSDHEPPSDFRAGHHDNVHREPLRGEPSA
ncbi:unnamed protein product [Lampetra fluviatilis]